MDNTLSDAVVARINRLVQGPMKVQCKVDDNGQVLPPRSLSLTMSFTVPELRALGIDVQVIGVNGEPLSDDAYAQLLLDTDKGLN
jgi:hypothetical protein